MRNWNINIRVVLLSYQNIYYLPMRNWNLSNSFKNLNIFLIYYLPMRNWNIATVDIPAGSYIIYYLPMRNWNLTCFSAPDQSSFTFTTYLWGIETCHNDVRNHIGYIPFTTYLWGIETNFLYNLQFLFYHLLLTYEELKLRSTCPVVVTIQKFTTYLWGIETFCLL